MDTEIDADTDIPATIRREPHQDGGWLLIRRCKHGHWVEREYGDGRKQEWPAGGFCGKREAERIFRVESHSETPQCSWSTPADAGGWHHRCLLPAIKNGLCDLHSAQEKRGEQ